MFDLSLSSLLIIKEKIASYLRLYVHEKEKQAIYFFLSCSILLLFLFSTGQITYSKYVYRACSQRNPK